MKKAYSLLLSRRGFIAVFLLCMSLMACSSIRLISDYDEETDHQLTLIRSLTADFISEMEQVHGTPAASYDSSQVFYRRIDHEIGILEFRVNSIPDNQLTSDAVGHIRSVILGTGSDSTSLRGVHSLGQNRQTGIDKTTLAITQRIIDQTISAALKLEIAKKRAN